MLLVIFGSNDVYEVVIYEYKKIFQDYKELNFMNVKGTTMIGALVILLFFAGVGKDILAKNDVEGDLENSKKKEVSISEQEMTKQTQYSFKEIPDEYYDSALQQGTIKRFDYKINNISGQTIEKNALVYLPYGYDQNDTAKKYNILYLMHGLSGSSDTWFGGINATNSLKNIIDNMIEKGDIDPLIIVTPSYYTSKSEDLADNNEQARKFQTEFEKYLMPAIEKKYHTYAETTDQKELQASRDHRAFGGYSMGSGTTWYALMDNIEYIKYFLPMSGDCWAYDIMGGENYPVETAKLLYEAVEKSGYGPNQFYIYSSVGGKDIAYEPVTKMLAELENYPSIFKFTDDFSQGNIHLDIAEDFSHEYHYGNHYIYNSLKTFFKY